MLSNTMTTILSTSIRGRILVAFPGLRCPSIEEISNEVKTGQFKMVGWSPYRKVTITYNAEDSKLTFEEE